MQAQRELTVQIVMFNQAVSERAGINVTETQCLNLLSMNSSAPLTAGHLAKMIGISTGATTRLIDRLERGGYVRRIKSPEDRRKVLVQMIPKQAGKVGRLHDSMRVAWAVKMAVFDDAQVALLTKYIELGSELMHQEACKLRAGSNSDRAY